MKKYLLMLILTGICVISINVPSRANDGVIIQCRTTPTPTPTPDASGRPGGDSSPEEVPSFWDFLKSLF